MENLHTTEFDEQLKIPLPHLVNYPMMLPFIGSEWKNSKSKILLLGESHYLPGYELDKITGCNYREDWYSNNGDSMENWLWPYLNTRDVVKKADERKKGDSTATLSIYYNPKAAIKAHYPEYENEKFIFPFLSFYNYFQRPAFVEGQSIKNNKHDDEIAYHTLKVVTKLIQPEKIIFCSKKAWSAFSSQVTKTDKQSVFSNMVIDYTCHPGTVYWNKTVKLYGNRTGHQKFKDILKMEIA
jgi:hypothetical protein